MDQEEQQLTIEVISNTARVLGTVCGHVATIGEPDGEFPGLSAGGKDGEDDGGAGEFHVDYGGLVEGILGLLLLFGG